MKVTEIAFTGYPVTDLNRARDFYENTLNLSVSDVFDCGDGKAWVEYEIGKGGVLAITNIPPDWIPSDQGGAVALEVEDFDEAVEWLKTKNVTIMGDPMDSGVCRILLIKDPDGNGITIHKRNPDREDCRG